MKVHKETLKSTFIFLFVLILLGVGYGIMCLSLGNTQPMSLVASDSMEPNIHKGDIIFLQSKNPSEIKNGTVENLEGDVIAYNPKGIWRENRLPPNDAFVIHRVVGKYYNETEQLWYFYTKGDNNYHVDPPYSTINEIPIPETHVKGIVVGRIPYIGVGILWFKQPHIFLPVLMVFGLIFIIQTDRDAHDKSNLEEYCQYHKSDDDCQNYYVELKDVHFKDLFNLS